MFISNFNSTIILNNIKDNYFGKINLLIIDFITNIFSNLLKSQLNNTSVNCTGLEIIYDDSLFILLIN